MTGLTLGPDGTVVQVDEPVSAADVRELIREHDRRLAARLQQAANLIVTKGQKHPDVRQAAFALRTIAEALEAEL